MQKQRGRSAGEKTAQLISIFVFASQIVQSLFLFKPNISRLYHSSVTVQAGLFWTWLKTLKIHFLLTWLFMHQHKTVLTCRLVTSSVISSKRASGSISKGLQGDSRAKVRDNYFSSVPAVKGKWRGFDIRILTPGRFSIAKGGAKSKVLFSSSPHGGGAYSRALKAESHNPRPSPYVGKQWSQIDWCISIYIICLLKLLMSTDAGTWTRAMQ